jgi:hypothetical protein
VQRKTVVFKHEAMKEVESAKEGVCKPFDGIGAGIGGGAMSAGIGGTMCKEVTEILSQWLFICLIKLNVIFG